jgi:3'(2'), 5'-bisphosphate nucleotidase
MYLIRKPAATVPMADQSIFEKRNFPLRRTSESGFDLDRATPDEIALILADAAVAAGPAVMEVYSTEENHWSKGDGSPVTLADKRAETIICGKLASTVPQVPVIAEESTSAGEPIVTTDRFLLVDPLDGTKEFIARNGEFTINVAFVTRGTPIAGAVFAPALGRLWFGGERAFVCDARVDEGLPEKQTWRPIRARRAPDGLIALASRSHVDPLTEAFLARLPVAQRLARGSSLKLCVIAEGLADVYPRFGPTMEWDTAAGDAVLRAAGGIVLDNSGAPLPYGKVADSLRNGAFVAWGDADAARRFA